MAKFTIKGSVKPQKMTCKFFKRVLEFLRKCHKCNKEVIATRDVDYSSEIADNLANEALLSSIVVNQQVCYLKTDSGEFFWNYKDECEADSDLIHF